LGPEGMGLAQRFIRVIGPSSIINAMQPILKVVQLNAASLFEPNWASRRVEILAWLDRLEPDVVCLQEVWEDDQHINSAGWLVDQRPQRWYWRFGGMPLQLGSRVTRNLLFGSAILSRWPIESSRLFVLPGEAVPDGFPQHGSAMELLAVRTGGVDVFSTHLSPTPQLAPTRRHQVRFIDSTIAKWRNRSSVLPPILCGDFNSEPDSDEIRFLCGLTSIDGVDTSWQEAWRASEQVGAGYTVHPSNPYFAPYNLSARRIDYVFVGETALASTPESVNNSTGSPTSLGRVLRAEIVFNTPLTDTLASDHYGLCVDIGWPGRPS
jgi:endonuclease/exonuclease/phosphatase family metal-dependent hydrolase